MRIGVRFVAVTLILSTTDLVSCLSNLTNLFLPEDGVLNFTQLAVKYGHSVEAYEVQTRDAYVLGLFRIPGFRDRNVPQKGLPVLLMHGVLDSADTWVIRGKDSLAITLADAGYDVWCGNTRGNRYSRRHIYLNPDKDANFWDFSFHEHGVYDLPSLIDFVLSSTGARKLNAIGHSQGNTIFYVMASTMPEYNQKVNVLTALAPVCYLHHVPNPLAALIELSPVIYKKAKSIGLYEFPGHTIGELIKITCSKPVVGYVTCALGNLFPVIGYDPKELEPSFFRLLVGHFPTGTSAKNLYHFGQVGRRRSFARFDYGPARNLEEYGSEMPPDYELARVTIPIALLVGLNDNISVVPDVALLRVQLPNVVEYSEIQRKLMNHADFVSGRTMRDYLFPHIFRILNRFR